MKKSLFLVLLRISLGWIFLWAFLDKLLGLGFATTPDKSWLLGSSPTYGFLKFGVTGMFKDIFTSLSGNPLVDWLFMIGLLGIGTALILGIAKNITTYSATLLLLLLWLATFPSKNNPFIDNHVIYILVIQVLGQFDSGEEFGLAKWWNKTGLVKQFPFLK